MFSAQAQVPPREIVMEIGSVLRYPYSKDQELPVIDGVPNYYHATNTPGAKRALLDSGINPIAAISVGAERRIPAILISSSPHKVGSHDTPWQDTFAPDVGHIRYFGDNKKPGRDPSTVKGNKALLAQFARHHSGDSDARAKAAPLLFFRRVPYGGKVKGFVQFQGFGLIDRMEVVTQYDGKNDRYFSNYVFDFLVLDMSSENERFDWRWISDRRNPKLGNPETLTFAPTAWREWLSHGPSARERIRRSVVKLLTVSTSDQQPQPGSKTEATLKEIYAFYEGRKTRFEALAADVVASRLTRAGANYTSGWVTPKGSDGGADFIGRVDIGTGFGRAKLIVLGQAKCESLNSPTGGNHVARTVARLQRGWIGAYVTTSYFSEKVQREILNDAFPIMLINGRDLAEEVGHMAQESGFASVSELLTSTDETYDQRVANRLPEEILRA